MYTDMGTILKDAAKNNYAVIATSAINLETARGAVAAAEEKKAPLIFLLGQNMMRQHAKAELIIPLVRKLALYSSVPVATCLDHGSDMERVLYSLYNGVTSIMFDGSLLSYEENVRKTAEITKLCHQLGLAVEGELGHVGMAANGDQKDTSIYTSPEEAKDFVEKTNVDCLAIAVGTAHGEYPEGLIPHIAFDRIRECKKATNNMPIALHGGSGAGDENIIKAVEAGINKINVVTDLFNACRNYLRDTLSGNPKTSYMDLMIGEEMAAKRFIEHWIDLSGSAGKAANFKNEGHLDRLANQLKVGDGE